jgi:hypothetical protein
VAPPVFKTRARGYPGLCDVTLLAKSRVFRRSWLRWMTLRDRRSGHSVGTRDASWWAGNARSYALPPCQPLIAGASVGSPSKVPKRDDGEPTRPQSRAETRYAALVAKKAGRTGHGKEWRACEGRCGGSSDGSATDRRRGCIRAVAAYPVIALTAARAMRVGG